MSNRWYVYILECADGTYYTGITNNVNRRIDQHNNDNTVGSKYTRARRPVVLVYREQVGTRSEALKREKEIKKLSRQTKKLLIGRVAQR